MGRIIDVNYQELYDMGAKFEEQGMKIKQLKETAANNFNSLKDLWTGADAFNYTNNATDLINELNKEMLYVLEWAEFFTKASYIYSGNVEEGTARLNSIKSILDEYQVVETDVNLV